VKIPIEDVTPRHDPVMVREILGDLRLEPGDVVFDGTLGLGGHSAAMLEKIQPGGTLVGTDWDEMMLAAATTRLQMSPLRAEVRLVKSDFRDLPELSRSWGLTPDAVLLDLGLNSAQVDDSDRGFSFKETGPLDMRMDRNEGEPASAVLNRMTPAQIETMLKELGDERWARAIAKQIVERRKSKPLKTTQDLVDCVHAAIPPGAREKRIHPATRTFQAVRIYVNGELDGLEEAVRDLSELLNPGGTIAILSYHSGEDRIVKHVFRELSKTDFEELHKKPLEASEAEVRANPRARSAKLRSLRRNETHSGSKEGA
jgi:16S rRNA (cytosine1402-N4)-methyltransferase